MSRHIFITTILLFLTVKRIICNGYVFVDDKSVLKDLRIDFTVQNHVFLKDNCATWENLIKEIRVNQRGIKSIEPHALERCTKVKLIDMSENMIEKLHTLTFSGNSNLTHLYLQCNGLTSLGSLVFEPLKNLQVLFLGGNPIRTLEPILTSGLKSLVALDVSKTQLTTMDVDLVKEKLPTLGLIYFDKNIINCEDYETIKKRFKELKVFVGESVNKCAASGDACLTSPIEYNKAYERKIDKLKQRPANCRPLQLSSRCTYHLDVLKKSGCNN